MKTQYANEIFSAINTLKGMIYEKMAINHMSSLKSIETVFSSKLSKQVIERYLLLIAKAAIKEAIGADIEIKLLVMLVGGYFISAKDAVVSSTLIERILRPQTNTYRLPEMAA